MTEKTPDLTTLNVHVERRHEDALTRLYVEQIPLDEPPRRSTGGFVHPWTTLRGLLELIDATDLPPARRRGRGRPRGSKDANLVHVVVRIRRDRLDALDRWAAAEGHQSRSAAVRALVDALISVRPDLAAGP